MKEYFLKLFISTVPKCYYLECFWKQNTDALQMHVNSNLENEKQKPNFNLILSKYENTGMNGLSSTNIQR